MQTTLNEIECIFEQQGQHYDNDIMKFNFSIQQKFLAQLPLQALSVNLSLALDG